MAYSGVQLGLGWIAMLLRGCSSRAIVGKLLLRCMDRTPQMRLIWRVYFRITLVLREFGSGIGKWTCSFIQHTLPEGN